MRKNIAAVLFLSVLLLDNSPVTGATSGTTSLSGGGSVSGNYNIRKTENDTTDSWTTSANAFLSLVHSRRGAKGGLSLSTALNYQYRISDGEGSGSLSDVRFSLNAWRQLSKRLSFDLNNTFIATNDLWAEWLSSPATGIPDPPPAEEEEEPTGEDTGGEDSTLSEKIGEEKFWTNDFTTSLNYQYAESGSVRFGYNNRILEYDETGRDNYQRDSVFTSISQGLGPRWNTGLSYRYTEAEFDISEDFTTHYIDFMLGYIHSVQDSFNASVDYTEKNYDTVDPESLVNPNNSYRMNGTLGWTHRFSPTKTLSMSAGPSYYHEDGGEDKTSANFSVYYTSSFKTGSWFVGASGGFTDRSFEGVETDQGVSEYQSIKAGVSWQVAKDVNAGLGASIRNDDFLENPLASDEKTYNAYGNISYRFWRWFYVSGRYWYVKTDSSRANDSEEHRFFITLGASRELKRWIH